MPIGLYALALAAFGIGLTEFGIVGLLPQVAADFSVSESVAGYLISGYALSVAIGAIGLTALLIRVERRKVLVGLMALFIVGNLMSAIAESYYTLMLGRIIAALCHGAFLGLGAIVATRMVGVGQQGSAIALMFAGLTVSNVFGVPLGTFLGIQLGWRSTFWALALIGLVTMVCIRCLVPPIPVPADTRLKSEMVALRRPQVWISAVISMLSFAGVIGAFTYIAFTLTKVSLFEEASVPWLLVLFGVGTFIGNIAGGRAADRWLNATLTVVLALLALVLIVFALTATDKIMAVLSLLLMGFIGLAAAPGLQLRIMGYAQDAPTIASGLNIAAFNVGNALGAWLGGLALGQGFGFTSPLWVGAGITIAALVVLFLGSYTSWGRGTASEIKI